MRTVELSPSTKLLNGSMQIFEYRHRLRNIDVLFISFHAEIARTRPRLAHPPPSPVHRSVASCFDDAHAYFLDIPEVAAQVRRGAVLCREQLLESTKMLRKVTQRTLLISISAYSSSSAHGCTLISLVPNGAYYVLRTSKEDVF